MQKHWKAFGFLAALELGVYLAVVTAVWAIAYHDLDILDRSAFAARDLTPERIMLGVTAVALVVNVLCVLAALAKGGQASVILTILLFSAGLATLAFAPMYVTVFGTGAVAGGLGLYLILRTILKTIWRVVSWPFRKLASKFRRAKPEASAPAPASKAAPSPPPKKKG
jgi:hypothetical protein